MPLFRGKKKAHRVKVKRYYREDGTTIELTEEQDRETRKLDAEMNWDKVERLKELGKACLRSKYFDIAEWIFERVMELDEDDDEAVMDFASSLLNQKRWEEAEEIVSNFLATYPNSSVAHQFMAAIHEHNGDHESAMEEIEEALEADPNNENVLWMLYWKVHGTRGEAGVLEKLQELAVRFPQAWGPMYILARHYEDLDPVLAKEHYENTLRRADTDAILISYTAFLGKTGNYRDLIKAVEARRKRKSVDFRVLFNLGEAYLEEGRMDDAREISMELQALAPPPYKRRLDDFVRRIRSAK